MFRRARETCLTMVLLTLALFSACDPDDGGQPPSSDPTPSATAAPAVDPGIPSSVVSQRLLKLPDDPSLNGFVAIDPETGDLKAIWLGTASMSDIDIYPGLATGRDAIWLSWADGIAESVRFDLEGSETGRAAGIWAAESPDGSVVMYYTPPTPSAPMRRFVALYADRTVDLGQACCGVARDDGRIAFLGEPTTDGGRPLLMYDPITDTIWRIAEHVGRPGKDGVIYPSWSPSGRFVFDYSFDETNPEQSYWIIADTVTREVITDAKGWFWQRGPGGEDWLGELVGGDLVYRDAGTDTEVLRLSAGDAEMVYAGDLGARSR